jgi:hypothetical protein
LFENFQVRFRVIELINREAHLTLNLLLYLRLSFFYFFLTLSRTLLSRF